MIRRSLGFMADPLFERMMFWPLSGPTLRTRQCLDRLDNTKYPTLAQFSLLISFVENREFYFDNDSNEILVEWGDQQFEQGEHQKSDLVMYNSRNFCAREGIHFLILSNVRLCR